ncbi:hypothetical protein AGMMS49574_09880 [Bacteroidia bacterium]|nr:hypothetical protein AGMMS49574_09880 [Bacteroidia bacterium]
MKQEEYQELLKDCAEFLQNVNSALQEQQENKKVSRDTQQKVCDSFADVFAKISLNKQFSTCESMLYALILTDAVSEYRYRTGNNIDINMVLYKLGIESFPDEIKKLLSGF